MADALSQAKAALAHASKAFPTPHEYSNTPYSLAKKAAPATKSDSDPGKEGESIKSGLAWKAQQVKAVLDSKQ